MVCVFYAEPFLWAGFVIAGLGLQETKGVAENLLKADLGQFSFSKVSLDDF